MVKDLFSAVGIVGILAFFGTITILNLQNNALWYKSFNKCIEAGMVPGQFSIVGSDVREFMCLPKGSTIIRNNGVE